MEYLINLLQMIYLVLIFVYIFYTVSSTPITSNIFIYTKCLAKKCRICVLNVMDRFQISHLISSEFKRIDQLLFTLKSIVNLWNSDDFTGEQKLINSLKFA